MINILWQDFVGGGGIDRPPNSALYGAGDSSHLCETQRSREVVALLLTPGEVHFLDPLGRIWSEDPFIGKYSDATMAVMIPIKCGPTLETQL